MGRATLKEIDARDNGGAGEKWCPHSIEPTVANNEGEAKNKRGSE